MHRRRRLVSLLATALVAGSTTAFLQTPATAGHTPLPGRVTLMGSLMSELGCDRDWSQTCAATDLERVGTSTAFAVTKTVPAGEYEWKVRLDGSWEENYGAGGVEDGPNLALALSQPAELRFSYDHATHQVQVLTTSPAPADVTEDDRARAGSSLRKDLTRERFYFVMADRFDNGDPTNDTGGFDQDSSGDGVVDRFDHGLDPTHKGFFHGGDLRGLINKLDYIEGAGTTAIWMTPSFKNKPVQGVGAGRDAGYHGYWITDFTQIDPHLGTNAELKELIDKAHARGIKVFFDIITNHTADVLDYQDSAYVADDSGRRSVPYKSKEAAPYRDADGNAFDDRAFTMGTTFPALDEDSQPYKAVFDEEADKTVKVPSWLNDPLMYHQRGTSTFAGEDAEYGDFPAGDRAALDDLWTERPEVVDGMIDIYKTWVRDAGVDGFRIDTVKHVNLDFWKRFGPELTGYAASIGNDDFFMFGEVYDADPRFMSRYTTAGRLQATVDFGFQGSGTNFAKGRPTAELRDFYAGDDWYTDPDSNAYSQPTFLGNHDMGRVGRFIAEGGYGGEELLVRDQLAHSLMYLTRGQPVVYYGDEQGFVGDGGDQDAREDMMPSEVATYNDNDLIGTDATTAQANFDTEHPLYRHLADLSALRDAHPALADGAQVHRYASGSQGVFAVSRIDAEEQVEYVVALNNSTSPETVTLDTFNRKVMYQQLWPESKDRVLSDDHSRITVTVPPLSAKVWRADDALVADPAPTAFFTAPKPADVVGNRAEIAVTVPEDGFNQVTFAVRPVGTTQWQTLGTDDNAPYRVFHDVSALPRGSYLEYRAVVRDHDGDLAVASSHGFVGTPPPASGGGGQGSASPVPQPPTVSVPGSHNSEMGCTPQLATAGGDWEPGCDAAQLELRDDGLWSKTFDLGAGQYEYKAAINRAWDENYGQGGSRNGSNIVYSHPGGEVTFFYDHRTNVVTSTSQTTIWAAAGDFQSELGCDSDFDPTCLNAWLQDADGDGVFVHRTDQIPAGSYKVKATKDQGWPGAVPAADVAFTVPEDGDIVRFTLDPEAGALGVTIEEPPVVPDLTTQRATWTAPDTIELDVPAGDRRGWSYRLHHGAEGSLAIDQETLGGSSVPLTLDPSSPESAERLLLSKKDTRDAKAIAGSGQLAVAVYDASGRVVDATGVAVGGWATAPGPPGKG